MAVFCTLSDSTFKNNPLTQNTEPDHDDRLESCAKALLSSLLVTGFDAVVVHGILVCWRGVNSQVYPVISSAVNMPAQHGLD